MTKTSPESPTISGLVDEPAGSGIIVALNDGVLSVTLNRPEKLNALSADMLIGLAETVDRARADERVKLLVLRSAGSGFSAGADIGSEDANDGGWSPEQVMDAVSGVVRGIVALPHPTVAIVPGAAVGLGASLALACDIVLCAQSAYFLLAFTKIGLMPDGGATALIPASLGRTRAMRLALLAERLAAAEAVEWGLAAAVHPDEALDAEAEAVIARLAAAPAEAMGKTKLAINSATLSGLDDALELEKRGQSRLMGSDDFAERVAAFRSRR